MHKHTPPSNLLAETLKPSQTPKHACRDSVSGLESATASSQRLHGLIPFCNLHNRHTLYYLPYAASSRIKLSRKTGCIIQAAEAHGIHLTRYNTMVHRGVHVQYVIEIPTPATAQPIIPLAKYLSIQEPHPSRVPGAFPPKHLRPGKLLPTASSASTTHSPQSPPPDWP